MHMRKDCSICEKLMNKNFNITLKRLREPAWLDLVEDFLKNGYKVQVYLNDEHLDNDIIQQKMKKPD